jgi:hypothetical protein
MILAIDPGSSESAYVVLDDNLKPLDFGKIENENLMGFLSCMPYRITDVAIEMVACYGMAVGKEVFNTCVWIGRFQQLLQGRMPDAKFIYRKDEKMDLCGTMKANDANISQALRDRFGEKGTKKNPGWFFGFYKDVWQAYAVGITYHDLFLKDGAK